MVRRRVLLNLGEQRLTSKLRVQIVQYQLAHGAPRFVGGAADMGLQHTLSIANNSSGT